MNAPGYSPSDTPIRSGWNVAAFLRGKPLTDKRIAFYHQHGYYSPAFQAARREFWASQAARRAAREGNFDKVDGRLIFRP